MSDPQASSSFLERWRWLRPDVHSDHAGRGARLWPDLGEVGRRRLAGLLADTLDRLEADSGLDPATVAGGRHQLARRLLRREIAECAHAPGRLDLAELVAGLLCSSLPHNPRLCLERLGRLRELTKPLEDESLPPGEAGEGGQAAERLHATARHIQLRLAGALDEASREGLEELKRLAGRIAGMPAALPAPPRPDRWEELLTEGGWELVPLLARVNEELARTARELERRAEVLRQRYLGPGAVGQGGSALSFVLEQFAMDPPRAEEWVWQHEGLAEELARFLGQLGLDAPPPRTAIAPGCPPRKPGPACDAWGRALLLPDLSLLDGGELRAHLAGTGHVLPPLLVAGEGLPGRAWRLTRTRSGTEGLAGEVEAALLRPGDLDAWANWSVDWLLRAGWRGGDLRLRLALTRLEQCDLLLARADLERCLAIRPEEEIRRRLVDDLGPPDHLAQAAWGEVCRQPGRSALAMATLWTFREAGRRWRRAHRQAASADWFLLLAECAPFPLSWLRSQLHQQPERGAEWKPLPPALVRPAAARGDGLLSEMEERLSALGRIRREDLEAGREFDGAVAAPLPVDEGRAHGAGEPHAPIE